MTRAMASSTAVDALAERQGLVREREDHRARVLREMSKNASAVEEARALAEERRAAAREAEDVLAQALLKQSNVSWQFEREQRMRENRLHELAPACVRETADLLRQLEEAVRQAVSKVPYAVRDRFWLVSGYEMGTDARERGEAAAAIRAAIVRVDALALTALPAAELTTACEAILTEIDELLLDAGIAERVPRA